MSSSRIAFKFVLVLLATVMMTSCSTPLFGTPTPTATPQPTNTSSPTATPTATPEPYYITASVVSGQLNVPILLWHRFGPETHDDNTTWVRISTFKAQLQRLYDAGFSVIPLSAWLDGSFSVPAGRRPLIITMDDGVFADQLFLTDDGTPAANTGIGVLWQFSKDHPDFGFAATIFCDVGDKDYADIAINDWFIKSNGDAWKTKLGKALAWALDNGVSIDNHTYQHADLSKTEPNDITQQLQLEDKTIRYFLGLAGRDDLASKLSNMIALPFGIWPATQLGMQKLLDYKNPEGLPVSAIFEAYNSTEAKLTPSVFSEGFDAMNLPRITATDYSVDWVIKNREQTPVMSECKLGPTSEAANNDAEALKGLISAAVQGGACPEGVYHVGSFIFTAINGSVSQYK